MAGYKTPEPGKGKKPLAHSASQPQEAQGGQPACDPAFKHGVVVGFDGSLSSERALAYAVGMAKRQGSGLVIVHVANRLPATVWAGCEPPVFVDVPDHRTEILGLELACADYLSDVSWILIERGGDICHELEEVGREYAADAIVVGGTRGLMGRLFGSVAGRLPPCRAPGDRHSVMAPAPVLRPGAHPSFLEGSHNRRVVELSR